MRKAASRLSPRSTTETPTTYYWIMSELETRELREDILAGLDLSFEKLVAEKKKTNSELAFAQNGEVVKVKAVEI